ncbi:MAG: hypothetical protein L3J96_02250 [Thermoplasmata archaeon]|nr:hypothetical protein [Thermoplasmata archaeon]
MTDWTSLSLSIAALAGTFLLGYFTWRQFVEQKRQFGEDFAEQKRQFDEQITADRDKISRLAALYEQLSRQSLAQERQVQLTAEQNQLLAKDVGLREEKLERDKAPLAKKIWRGLFGG